MTLTSRLNRAVEKAAKLHDKQLRKGRNLPYVSHPYSVALILSKYLSDDDVIIAGLLHDILEDVPEYSHKHLEDEFGARVARIVREVSQDKPLYPPQEGVQVWKYVKKAYIEKISCASTEALLVCAADKIHNLNATIEDHKEEGDAFWEKFSAPKEDQAWFYKEVLGVVRERVDHPIVYELEATWRRAKTSCFADVE